VFNPPGMGLTGLVWVDTHLWLSLPLHPGWTAASGLNTALSPLHCNLNSLRFSLLHPLHADFSAKWPAIPPPEERVGI